MIWAIKIEGQGKEGKGNGVWGSLLELVRIGNGTSKKSMSEVRPKEIRLNVLDRSGYYEIGIEYIPWYKRSV